MDVRKCVLSGVQLAWMSLLLCAGAMAAQVTASVSLASPGVVWVDQNAGFIATGT